MIKFLKKNLVDFGIPKPVFPKIYLVFYDIFSEILDISNYIFYLIYVLVFNIIQYDTKVKQLFFLINFF